MEMLILLVMTPIYLGYAFLFLWPFLMLGYVVFHWGLGSVFLKWPIKKAFGYRKLFELPPILDSRQLYREEGLISYFSESKSAPFSGSNTR